MCVELGLCWHMPGAGGFAAQQAWVPSEAGAGLLAACVARCSPAASCAAAGRPAACRGCPTPALGTPARSGPQTCPRTSPGPSGMHAAPLPGSQTPQRPAQQHGCRGGSIGWGVSCARRPPRPQLAVPGHYCCSTVLKQQSIIQSLLLWTACWACCCGQACLLPSWVGCDVLAAWCLLYQSELQHGAAAAVPGCSQGLTSPLGRPSGCRLK